jgi:hypothetical protein
MKQLNLTLTMNIPTMIAVIITTPVVVEGAVRIFAKRR